MSRIGGIVRRVGCAALLGTTMVLGLQSAASAGIDPGTGGSGYTIYPTSSPYISYAVVTSCYPTTALIAQAKAVLSGVVALGPKSVNSVDGESFVSLRRVGTYSGHWYCMRIA